MVVRGRTEDETIRICAWCRRANIDGEWTSGIGKHPLLTAAPTADLDTTHGICPECAEKYERDLDLLDQQTEKKELTQ